MDQRACFGCLFEVDGQASLMWMMNENANEVNSIVDGKYRMKHSRSDKRSGSSDTRGRLLKCSSHLVRDMIIMDEIGRQSGRKTRWIFHGESQNGLIRSLSH